MAKNTINVAILGDWKNLQKTLGDAQGGVSKWASGMSTAGKNLSLGLTLPIVAAAGVATKAAAEEQQQVEGLADAIRQQIPGATQEAIDANEDWVSSLQSGIAQSDGDIRALQQRLISAGASVEKSQELTALAFDVAARTGKDAATVAEAFAKAQNGNVTALGKLGVATKDAAGETRSFEDITKDLASTMGGAAAEQADTAAGRAKNLQLQIADLTESIGTLLLPILDQLVGMLSGVVKWFQDLDPGAQKAILAIAGVAAALGPVLLVIGKVVSMGPMLIQGFQAVGKAWGVLSKLFMTNPWLLLIAAVVALVVLIIANWDKISAFLKRTWENIQRVARAVWEGIKNAIKAAADWLVRMFLNWTLAGLIIKHWDKIKAGVLALKDWLVNTWNSILGFFRGLPAKVGNALSGLFDGIKNTFRNAINWVISKWNAFRLTIKLPALLGGGTIRIDTPNIPTFQFGGMFRAPAGRSSGLALLHDRETVTPAGGGGGGTPSVVNILPGATFGVGTSPVAVAKAVLEALQAYQRVNGPLPLDVRLA